MINVRKKQKICSKCNGHILQRINVCVLYNYIWIYVRMYIVLYHNYIIYVILSLLVAAVFSLSKNYIDHHSIVFPFTSWCFQQTFAGSSRKSQTCPAPLSACWTLRCHYRNWKAAKDLQSRIQQQLSKVIYNATFCSGSCFTCFWDSERTIPCWEECTFSTKLQNG